MPKNILIRDLSKPDNKMLEELKKKSTHNTYSKCLLEAGHDAIKFKKLYEETLEKLRILEGDHNRLTGLFSERMSIDKEIGNLISKDHSGSRPAEP